MQLIKTTWKPLLRLFFSVFAVFIIFYQVNFSAVLTIMIDLNLHYFFLALLLQIASSLVAAYKWGKIMNRLGSVSSFFSYAKIYLIGCLFNQVLPTSIGGDAVRVAYANRLGAGIRSGFYSVFTDRYFGILGLLLLNVASLHALYNKIPHSIFLLLCFITVSITACAILALIPSQFPFLKNKKLLSDIYHLSQTLLSSLRTKQTFLLLFLGVVSNFLTIYAVYYIACALHLPIQLIDLLGMMPAIILITLLPISFAGWGLREGTMIGFLLFLGLSKSGILALSVLYGILLILASLPGLYFYLFNRVSSYEN